MVHVSKYASPTDPMGMKNLVAKLSQEQRQQELLQELEKILGALKSEISYGAIGSKKNFHNIGDGHQPNNRFCFIPII